MGVTGRGGMEVVPIPIKQSRDSWLGQLPFQVSKIDPAAHESDAKHELVDKIDTYIQEKIVFADNVLVTNAVAKVYTDDVILTYGFSSVVFNVLLRAKKVCKPCTRIYASCCFALLLKRQSGALLQLL